MSQHQLAALESSVLQMQNALVMAMEEVEAVRKDMLVENAKLQREFRDTVDVILQQSQDLRALSRSAKGKPQRFDDSRGPDVSPIPGGDFQMQQSAIDNMAARLTSLENSVGVLQSQAHMSMPLHPASQDSVTVTASGAASPFVHDQQQQSSLQPLPQQQRRALQPFDDVLLSHAKAMFAEMLMERDAKAAVERERTAARLEELESRTKAIQHEFQRRMDGTETKNESMRGAIGELRKDVVDVRTAHQQQQQQASSPRFGVAPEVVRAIRESADTLRLELSTSIQSSQRSSEKQAANLQKQCETLTDVVEHLHTETDKMKDEFILVPKAVSKVEQLAKLVASQHEDIQQTREETQKMHKEASGGTAEAASRCSNVLREVQKFADEFTTDQVHVIRDEVLSLIQSDTALTQRRIEEKQRRDEMALLKQDVLRALTQVEAISDEMSRLMGQQRSLQQSFQRTEQVVSGLSFKIDTAMKDEFARAEALQKSFFVRQETLIREERHELALNITADVQKMQVKHSEEISKIEQRRLDDMTGSQTQLREDFVAFISSQRQALDDSLISMKSEISRQTTAASEELARGYTSAIDVNKRLQSAVVDDLRKAIGHVSDETRRVSGQNEENTKRLSEQHTFLHTRFQQLVEDELRRAERITMDLQLRLNQQVDEEVKRAVSATEGALRNSYLMLDERLKNSIRALKEELTAVRDTLQTVVAPSATMSAIDSRVDVLRRDVTDLREFVNQSRNEEIKMLGIIKTEVRPLIDSAKSDILRDIGSQLSRFDNALADAVFEQERNSRVLVDVSQRVEDCSRLLDQSGLGTNGASEFQMRSTRTPPPFQTPATGSHTFGGSSSIQQQPTVPGNTPRPTHFVIPSKPQAATTAMSSRGTTTGAARSAADLLLLSSPRFDSGTSPSVPHGGGKQQAFGVGRRTPPPPTADLLVGAFADAGSP